MKKELAKELVIDPIKYACYTQARGLFEENKTIEKNKKSYIDKETFIEIVSKILYDHAMKTKKQSELKRIFSDFCKKLEEGTVPMPSEFVDIIDDNFWDLI